MNQSDKGPKLISNYSYATSTVITNNIFQCHQAPHVHHNCQTDFSSNHDNNKNVDYSVINIKSSKIRNQN